MKTTMGSITQVINTMQRALSRQTDRLERMEQERWDNMRAVEQIMSAAHERDMEKARVASREKRLDDLMNRLGVMIPVVAQKLLAKPASAALPANQPQSASSADIDTIIVESVKALMESLEPAQKSAIFGCLTPQQADLLKNGSAVAIKELLPTLDDSQRATIFGALKDEQKALLINTTQVVFQ